MNEPRTVKMKIPEYRRRQKLGIREIAKIAGGSIITQCSPPADVIRIFSNWDAVLAGLNNQEVEKLTLGDIRAFVINQSRKI